MAITRRTTVIIEAVKAIITTLVPQLDEESGSPAMHDVALSDKLRSELQCSPLMAEKAILNPRLWLLNNGAYNVTFTSFVSVVISSGLSDPHRR
jgi:hypothetical protein